MLNVSGTEEMAERPGEDPPGPDAQRSGGKNVSQIKPSVYRRKTKKLSAENGKLFSIIAKDFLIFLLTFSEKCV